MSLMLSWKYQLRLLSHVLLGKPSPRCFKLFMNRLKSGLSHHCLSPTFSFHLISPPPQPLPHSNTTGPRCDKKSTRYCHQYSFSPDTYHTHCWVRQEIMAISNFRPGVQTCVKGSFLPFARHWAIWKELRISHSQLCSVYPGLDH